MLNLIPKPYMVKEENGVFKLNKNASVFTEIELPLLEAEQCENADIKIFKDDSFEKEEYYLSVDKNGICIKASCVNGAYYALQSVRMLGRFDEGQNEIPFVEIFDKPKYKWRGINLDESRHMFGKKYIKKFIDDMFRLKLNVLHWHLTDDVGWRIEIKKYPLLTEIGSKRPYTQIGGWGCNKTDGKPYGGFYTQEDIKEIVEYAEMRCVSIMPEIDVPAHFAAALAAYPHLACRNLKRDVQGFYGNTIPFSQGIKDWNRPVCLGKEETVQFILDIYDEVCDLFPFGYFHVGGDECDITEWKSCPVCQKTMKEKGFKDEHELQLMLTNRLCDYLKSKGKHMVGWNEILRFGMVDKTAIAQYWVYNKDKVTMQYAANGGKIIMSKHEVLYFNMPYAICSLKETYNFKLKKYGIHKKSEENVLGIEGEMWTEWITTTDQLEFMLHPRLEVLSEIAWLDERQRDYKNFLLRYRNYKSVYKYLGINYAVDKLSMPKNRLKRNKLKKLFYNGDPNRESKLNKEYKSKGEL